MLNLDQTSQPAERTGFGKRISDLWNSGNRRARLLFWAASGLVLNCCCIIIPLWDSSGGP